MRQMLLLHEGRSAPRPTRGCASRRALWPVPPPNVVRHRRAERGRRPSSVTPPPECGGRGSPKSGARGARCATARARRRRGRSLLRVGRHRRAERGGRGHCVKSGARRGRGAAVGACRRGRRSVFRVCRPDDCRRGQIRVDGSSMGEIHRSLTQPVDPSAVNMRHRAAWTGTDEIPRSTTRTRVPRARSMMISVPSISTPSRTRAPFRPTTRCGTGRMGGRGAAPLPIAGRVIVWRAGAGTGGSGPQAAGAGAKLAPRAAGAGAGAGGWRGRRRASPNGLARDLWHRCWRRRWLARRRRAAGDGGGRRRRSSRWWGSRRRWRGRRWFAPEPVRLRLRLRLWVSASALAQALLEPAAVPCA